MPSKKSLQTIVVDIGLQTTDVLLFKGDTCVGHYAIHLAGDAVTRAIATRLDISMAEAEELKCATEFFEEKKTKKVKGKKGAKKVPISETTKKVRASVEPIVQAILEGVQDAIEITKTDGGFSPRECILTGGSSEMKGLAHYCESILKIPVSMRNTATKATRDEPMQIGQYTPDLDAANPWIDEYDPDDNKHETLTDLPASTSSNEYTFITPLTTFFSGILIGMLITYILLGAIGR